MIFVSNFCSEFVLECAAAPAILTCSSKNLNSFSKPIYFNLHSTAYSSRHITAGCKARSTYLLKSVFQLTLVLIRSYLVFHMFNQCQYYVPICCSIFPLSLSLLHAFIGCLYFCVYFVHMYTNAGLFCEVLSVNATHFVCSMPMVNWWHSVYVA